MSQTDLQIKISVEAQLQQLRAMEAQFQRQIVQLRALGDTGSEALKTLERNLSSVRGELGNIGRLDKINAALGDGLKSIPGVGVAMGALNGSAAALGAAFTGVSFAVHQTFAAMREATVLVDTANQIGVTSTAVQALNAHFGDAGIRGEQWQAATLKLGQSLAQAAAGVEPMQQAFAALGLDVVRLRAMRPDEALAAVGRALGENRDNAAATAGAYQILGEQAGRMRATLEDLGRQGAGELQRAMIAAGRATEEELNKRLNEAQLKWDALMQRVKNTRNVMAAFALSPVESYVAPFALGGRDGLAQTERKSGQAANEQEAALAELRLRKADEARIAEAEAATRAAAAADAEAKFAAFRAQIASEEKAEAEAQARLLEQINEAEIAALPPAEQRVRLDARRAEVSGEIAAGLKNETTSANTLLALRLEELRLAARVAAIDAQSSTDAERATASAREAAQLRARTAVDQLETERQILASNASLDPVTKARQLAELTERLKGALDEVVKLKRAEVALATDPLGKAKAEAELAAAEARRQAAGQGTPPDLREIDRLRAQRDAIRSLDEGRGGPGIATGEGVEAGGLRMLAQFGSDGEIIARGVGQAFNGVFEGLRGSIQGLIEGTMTWGDALRNIGSSILSGVISAISEMFATWMAKRLLIFLFGEKLKAAESASTVAHETATLPAKTAGAVASGISSYGFAIAGGLAAAALIASFAGAFAEGGLVTGPGTGTSDSVFARLSNGEYVMPAARVSQYGQGFFDDLRAGRMPEMPSGGVAAAAAAPVPADRPDSSSSQHLAFFFDREEAMRSALNSPAGKRMFVDMLRATLHEI